MAQNQSPRWILDPEIESSYEAIGRAVVETAMAEAKQAKNMGEHEYEATVTLRFTVNPSAAQGARPLPETVCCICSIATDGTVICRGRCCH